MSTECWLESVSGGSLFITGGVNKKHANERHIKIITSGGFLKSNNSQHLTGQSLTPASSPDS